VIAGCSTLEELEARRRSAEAELQRLRDLLEER